MQVWGYSASFYIQETDARGRRKGSKNLQKYGSMGNRPTVVEVIGVSIPWDMKNSSTLMWKGGVL